MLNFTYSKFLTLLFAFVAIFGIMPIKAQISAVDAIYQMQKGINIGETFDSPSSVSWQTPISTTLFDDYQAAGFTAVRIPITWDSRLGTASPYTVDAQFMDQIYNFVSYGLSKGLYIIINVHHDDWIKDNYSTGNKARFDALWLQISNKFKNSSDHLLFEIINEPHNLSVSNLNDLQSRAVGIIRGTGGNNSTRNIVFTGTGFSDENNLMAVNVPENDHSHLIGNCHLYSPWSFADDETGTVKWGTSGDQDAIASIFNRLKTWSTNNNVAVMVNEFGTKAAVDYNSRMNFFNCYMKNAIRVGFGIFAWDDNGGFRVFNRAARNWNPNVKDLITQPIFAVDGVDAVAWWNMSGVQRETTTDGGNDHSVGFIDTNDWLTYQIWIPKAGSYQIELRVASINATGVVSLQNAAGTQNYGTLNVPNTGGWQKWTSIIKIISLPSGLIELKLLATTGGFNLNSIKLTANNTPVTGVSFSQASLAIALNEVATLKANITPSNASNLNLIWSSSNSTIASIDANGVVTGKAIGSTLITAKTVDGGFVATETINVQKIAVSAIVLTPNPISIVVGNTSQLSAVVTPSNASNPSVSWTTSDANIATVDATGLVSAKKEGSANITVVSFDNGSVSASVLVTVKAQAPYSLKIEAENYDHMSGIQTESTTDIGGGLNVGWTDAGDFMDYQIISDYFLTTTNTLSLRVASTVSTGQLQVKSGSTVLKTINIPNTNGWQNWQTITTTIILPPGHQYLGLYIVSGSFNINWLDIKAQEPLVLSKIVLSPATASLSLGASQTFTATAFDQNNTEMAGVPFTWTSSNSSIASISTTGVLTSLALGTTSVTATSGSISAKVSVNIVPANTCTTYKIGDQIEAEKWCKMSGIQTENTSDTGGGLNCGWINANDFMTYTLQVDTAGSYTISYRVASQNGGGSIQFKNGNAVIGSISVPSTDGWQAWTTISHTVTLPAGLTEFTVYVAASGFNLNWLKVSKTNVIINPTCPAWQAGTNYTVGTVVTYKSINYTSNNDWNGTAGAPDIATWGWSVGGSCLKAGDASTNNTSDEVSKNERVIVFPNPVNEELKIVNNLEGVSTITIYELSGKVIFESKIETGNNTINVNSLKTGFYLVTISNGKFVKNEKIVKL